jgi:methionyl aminopeptidase
MIVVKSEAELEKMHRAGLVVYRVLADLRAMLQTGITTRDLDATAEKMVREMGARPAFKGYMGFPGSLCASLNSEIVHGIPSPRRRLRAGDIISLDFGAECDGYYADAALTAAVDETTPERERLMQVTRDSLDRAIERVRPGNHLGDISAAVQQVAEGAGFSVVREFVGHGIGTKLHEEPQLPNYGEPGHGPPLRAGMVLAIEPMVNAGGPQVRVLEDKWTAVTVDGSDSAHFEHTVAVTANGPWILTRPRDMTGPCW